MLRQNRRWQGEAQCKQNGGQFSRSSPYGGVLEFCRWRTAEASEAATLEEFPAAPRIGGKVAVVACASSGIGRTIAEHDAEEGPGWCLSRTAPWKPSIPSFRSISSTRRRSCVSSSPASARGSIRFITNFPTQLGPCGQEIVVDGGYTIG